MRSVNDSPIVLPRDARDATLRVVEVTLARHGATLHLLLSASPLLGADGETLGSVITLTDITKRKQAEAVMLERTALREQLERTAEAVPGVVCTSRFGLDGDASFPYVSSKFQDVCGVSAEDVRDDSAPLCALIHRTDISGFRASIAASARTMTPWQAEWRIDHPQKGQVWLEGVSMPVAQADGSVLWHGFIQDITGRKRAEGTARKERVFREMLVESIPGVYCALDAAGYFLSWNKRVEAVTERSRDKLARLNALALFDADDRPRVTNWIREVFEQGQSVLEAVVVAKSGTRSPYYFSGVRVDVEGQPILVGTGMDITERKQSEQLLHENHQRLQQILEVSRAGTWRIDFQSGQESRDSYLNTMLGYPSEATTQSLDDRFNHIHPDDFPAAKAAYEHSKATGIYEIDHRIVRRDGGILWVSDRGTVIRNERGELLYAIGAAIDITTSKKAAEELEQYRMHLEALVAERTQQLEKERHRAEAASRAKSVFLANMSHEIRTPLNGVLGMAQLGWRHSPQESKERQTFAHILESGKLLFGIVNDILDFSKIEAGKLRLESVIVRPGQIMDDVISMFRERARAKGLVLNTLKAPDLPRYCLGDPLRITQILINLTGNAVKFTERGSVTLRAELRNERLFFQIEDTGIGMSAEQLQRIFAPFEQADWSTTRRFGGTGLGLAITQRLVELMGGELAVTSELGEGSVFEVLLPCVTAMDDHVLDTRTVGAEVTPEARLQGLRVLVAEDNPVNRLVIEEMLTDDGAAVTSVENGRLAVEAVLSDPNRWDLVLMDLQMPEMDGLEATRRIRQRAPAVPVIGQSAHALAEEREQCLEAGMADLVTKPIEQEELVAAVLRYARRTGKAPKEPPIAELPLALSDGAPPIVDWTAALRERYEGKPAFVERLVQLAIQEYASIPQQLREWASSGKVTEIAATAHSLKGALGNLMAQESAALAASTQQAARANSPETLALAMQLAEVVERLLQVLAEHHSGNSPPPAE